MSVKRIVEIPDPILKKKTQKVGQITDEIKEIAKDLVDTVKQAKDPEGAGLAATQIGYSKRMCVVRNFYESFDKTLVNQSDDYVLINPKIVSKSKETDTDWEGCLSVPDKYGKVERYNKIKVTAQDLDGETIKIKASGYFSRTIQHEIDHLDGVLFTDKVIGETVSEQKFNELIEQ